MYLAFFVKTGFNHLIKNKTQLLWDVEILKQKKGKFSVALLVNQGLQNLQKKLWLLKRKQLPRKKLKARLRCKMCDVQ